VLTPYLVTLQYSFAQTFPAPYLQSAGTRPFWLPLAGYTNYLYCRLLCHKLQQGYVGPEQQHD
jgi:hypothetical protein